MSGNEKKVPKRRFKEFENAEGWEERKIEEIGTVQTCKRIFKEQTSESGDIPFYKNGTLGIKADAYISKEVFEEYKELYPYPRVGDVLISVVGSIGRTAEYKGNAEYFQDSNIVWLKTDNNIIDKTFLKISYQIIDWLIEGSTIKHLYNDNILASKIWIPSSIDEQKAIGGFFDFLDNIITLHQRKLEKMKALKKAYITEMFPAEGERKPKLRFAGFTDDWEQRKFDELADYKKGPFGSALTKDMFVHRSNESVKVYEQQNAINKNWKLERYYIPKNYAIKLNSFEVHAGDIIVSCAGTIGEIYTLPEDSESGIINQALMRVRVDENIVDKELFIYLFSNMIDLFSKIHSNGSAMKNIPPFSDLKPTIVYIPSMAEQKKLVGLLIKMDTLITLHKNKLEKLQNIKKAYLNEMFI